MWRAVLVGEGVFMVTMGGVAVGAILSSSRSMGARPWP